MSPTTESEATTTLVTFSRVSKTYGTRTVLQGVDLDIARGEKVSIIGPSGSGKTTVLRILMTLVRPDAGHVLVEGKHLWHQEKRGQLSPASERHLRSMRGGIGMVFQHFNLFPHLTVIDNVTEALVRVQHQSKSEARELAASQLNLVGMAPRSDAYPWQLSGGQQQRVAIARAIALRPSVLLFDEVTSALDPERVGEVLAVLRNLAEQSNIAMLFVTHEMRFAREVSDRVVMFDEGRIIESGPPEKIFDSPESERTQRFLRAVRVH